jgi:hypothetical protein
MVTGGVSPCMDVAIACTLVILHPSQCLSLTPRRHLGWQPSRLVSASWASSLEGAC